MSEAIRAQKNGKKISALTAYDYPTARILDECGIDIILVGDSLGMVVLGYPDTTQVTIEDMLHHTRAVSRGVTQSLVVADLSYGSYETSEYALLNSKKLIQAGARAVKLEGGVSQKVTISTLVESGIPIIAHIGMLPQKVREEGGYHVKGKTSQEIEQLLEDAHAVAEAGAFAVVLELIADQTTRRITEELSIPTIGIGSGPYCDGQILVTHDLIGFFPWFKPSFVVQQATIAKDIKLAAEKFIQGL